MKMKLLAVLIVAVLAAGMAQAADYDKGQMSNVRVYRVALGAGTAPSAADMAYNGVHNGDFVLNVSDNALYIMNASNVYVKITAAGAMTVAGAINGVTLNTSTVTNVLAAGSVLPAVDMSAPTNGAVAHIHGAVSAVSQQTTTLNYAATNAPTVTPSIQTVVITNVVGGATNVYTLVTNVTATATVTAGSLAVGTNVAVTTTP